MFLGDRMAMLFIIQWSAYALGTALLAVTIKRIIEHFVTKRERNNSPASRPVEEKMAEHGEAEQDFENEPADDNSKLAENSEPDGQGDSEDVHPDPHPWWRSSGQNITIALGAVLITIMLFAMTCGENVPSTVEEEKEMVIGAGMFIFFALLGLAIIAGSHLRRKEDESSGKSLGFNPTPYKALFIIGLIIVVESVVLWLLSRMSPEGWVSLVESGYLIPGSLLVIIGAVLYSMGKKNAGGILAGGAALIMLLTFINSAEPGDKDKKRVAAEEFRSMVVKEDTIRIGKTDCVEVKVPLLHRLTWESTSPVAYEMKTQTGKIYQFPRSSDETVEIKGRLSRACFRVTDDDADSVSIAYVFSRE